MSCAHLFHSHQQGLTSPLAPRHGWIDHGVTVTLPYVCRRTWVDGLIDNLHAEIALPRLVVAFYCISKLVAGAGAFENVIGMAPTLCRMHPFDHTTYCTVRRNESMNV
jgi:hypothetical protein